MILIDHWPLTEPYSIYLIFERSDGLGSFGLDSGHLAALEVLVKHGQLQVIVADGEHLLDRSAGVQTQSINLTKIDF